MGIFLIIVANLICWVIDPTGFGQVCLLLAGFLSGLKAAEIAVDTFITK